MAFEMKKLLDQKKVFLTGGTGSLGRAFLNEVLAGKFGDPDFITVFSRDEAKQFYLQAELENNVAANESIIYENWREKVRFFIGDIRELASIKQSLPGHDLIVHAAALKQVPSCEHFPVEAMKTNCIGAENLVRVINEDGRVEKCIFISTDKAAKPTNAMGISKALQEKIFIAANQSQSETVFAGVRYGNVIASRGSVIPVFIDQLKNKMPITVTDIRMSRFLLSLEEAVETIMASIACAGPGDIVVPNARSAKITDLIEAVTQDMNYPTIVTGIRPGEKLHEIMISIEEAVNLRRIERKFGFEQEFFIICSQLPQLLNRNGKKLLDNELSSEDSTISVTQIRQLLSEHNLI